MSSEESRLISGARELTGAEVLIVDGDPTVHRGMMQVFAPAGLVLSSAPSPEKAMELIGNKFFGVVVIDLDTPGTNGGIELVKKVRERSPTTIVIVLSSRKSFDSAVAAFRAGAHDVIIKAPDQVDYLRARVTDAAGDANTRRGTGTLLAEVRDSYEDFLKRFMEAERRFTDLEDKVAGRDTARSNIEEDVRVVFVDQDERLYKAVATAPPTGFTFELVQTGGEALDHITSSKFHLALVGPTLPDLPSSMVVKALKKQAPDLIVIAYEPNGRLEIVEVSKTIPLVEKFTAARQLTDRLSELAEAHRAKGRERRYLQAFRDRHYEFLRKLAELRKKLERAIEDEKDTFTYSGK